MVEHLCRVLTHLWPPPPKMLAPSLARTGIGTTEDAKHTEPGGRAKTQVRSSNLSVLCALRGGLISGALRCGALPGAATFASAVPTRSPLR